MAIAIIFETLEGHTGKIARFAESTARKAGHDVALIDTADRMVSASLDGIEMAILAAPVHERRHPRNFEVFIGASKQDLAACGSMMVSVSLSAAFPDGMEEAREYLTEMEMRTGFKADVTTLVAGAVKPGGYDYFQSQVVRHNVLQGRGYDLQEGAREFTDWDALEGEISTFLRDQTSGA